MKVVFAQLVLLLDILLEFFAISAVKLAIGNEKPLPFPFRGVVERTVPSEEPSKLATFRTLEIDRMVIDAEDRAAVSNHNCRV